MFVNGCLVCRLADLTFRFFFSFQNHANLGALFLSFDPTLPTNTTRRQLRQEDNSLTSVLERAGAAASGFQKRANIRDLADVNRELQKIPESHSIPPSLTPEGCAYSFEHGDAVFIDMITCPDWCGPGLDFTYSISTLCVGEDCDTFDDCRVAGCNDDCGDEVGDCPCPTRDFEEICELTCPATEAPTFAPTSSPTVFPTQAPTAATTTAAPTPASTTAPTQTPTTAGTTTAPTGAPTDAPATAIPTPGGPTTIRPTSAPTNGPTPSPTQDATTPAPTPDSTMRPNPELPRQQVNLVRTLFFNNSQGFPLEATSRGVITTGSGFNDIDVMWSEFAGNVFETQGVRTIQCR